MSGRSYVNEDLLGLYSSLRRNFLKSSRVAFVSYAYLFIEEEYNTIIMYWNKRNIIENCGSCDKLLFCFVKFFHGIVSGMKGIQAFLSSKHLGGAYPHKPLRKIN